jgi:hypothetical protein
VLALCVSAACSDVDVVTVEIAVIELEPRTATIVAGESVQLEARLLDEAGNVLKGRDIVWSSSDSVAATVDAAGLVHGTGAGQTTITAASGALLATADITVHRPAPTLAAVQPSSAQRLQDVDLILIGSGFAPGMTTVSLGSGITLGPVQVNSATSIAVRATIAAATQLGARDIAVAIPGPGGGTATLAGGFTVLPEHPAPAVTAASPDAGQRRDQFDVRLTGTGFVPNVTTVSFGPGVTVNSVQVHEATSLTANIRIGADAELGSRAVTVTNGPPGGGTAMRANAFTVLEENPAPGATRALPESGRRGSTLSVIVLGSGFVQGLTSVSFGDGISVNSVTVVFWTSLSANITIAPDAALGPRNVTVTNPAPGGGTFIMNDGFHVQTPGGGG